MDLCRYDMIATQFVNESVFLTLFPFLLACSQFRWLLNTQSQQGLAFAFVWHMSDNKNLCSLRNCCFEKAALDL